MRFFPMKCLALSYAASASAFSNAKSDGFRMCWDLVIEHLFVFSDVSQYVLGVTK